MKIKYAFLFALALLAGCNEKQTPTTQAPVSAVKLQDGSEIQLTGKLIDTLKKPNAEGVMSITKLRYSENIEAVQAEFESKLKPLGYTPYSLPSAEGVKFNYTKPSAPSIGLFLKSNTANGETVSTASIYWNEPKI